MKNFFSILTPIIIAVQETWFLPTDSYNFQLSNYTLYRCDELYGQRRHGGTALYIQNDYTHCQLNINTDLQAIACTTYINGRNIDVCSIYIPPDFDNSDLLRQLNHLVAQFNNPFLLLGDFNAHSPAWWDGQLLDARGKIMEDFVDIHNLVTLNCNLPTFFHLSHNIESAVDLSLSSPCIATWFQWTVDGDIHDSDHYPISLRFTFDVAGIPHFIPRWNLERADWTKFTELCEFVHHDRYADPVEGISYITETILSAAQQSIPLTKPCKKGNAVPWWSPAVRQAIAKRKRAFRAYLRLRTNAALIDRNRERAIAKRVIRKAKRESWQSLLSVFTSATPLSRIWNMVRRLSGKRISPTFPVLRLPGTGQTVSAPADVVYCLAEKIAQTSSNTRYYPGFVNDALRRFHINRNDFHSDNQEDYNALFTIHELNDAISAAGNTSVGPDKLHYAFFRHLSDSCKVFVLHTFNSLFRMGMFPDSWYESTVAALLKPGKARYDPSNYRPIAMTSCLGKLLERMVSKRFSFVLYQRKLLSKFQCGFRKNHSTIDQLIRLESDIRKGYKRKQHTVVIFLDVKNAYDMVFKPAVLYKIHKLGIKGNLATYLCNFLSQNRRFRVRHRSIISNTFVTENGLPQGSCLSPLLFNITIDDLFHDLPTGISFSLFADDSSIWCTTPDIDHGIQRLQIALRTVEKWSVDHGLEFSAQKSALMIFTKHRRIAPASLPKLNNIDIPLVPHFKFLGVVLDSRLTMSQHVKHIQNKCKRRLNLFRCLTSSPVGADRSTLLRLYKALVLPVIEYGSVLYAGGSTPNLLKLEAIQNTFLRIALGVMRTSPINSLQVEADIMPLHIRRMDLTMRYFAKIKLYPDHAASNAITTLPRLHFSYLGPCEKRTGLTIASRIKKYEGDLDFKLPDVTPLPHFPIAPWLVHPLSISFLFTERKANVSPLDIQYAFVKYQSEHPRHHFLFTDGSKSNVATGIGIFSRELPGIRLRLSNSTSIYSAELYAIFVALQLVRDHRFPSPCICSDSKSALQSLKYPTFTQHLHIHIAEIHHQLLTDGADIQFMWVPGHSGITGNDKADFFAKQALTLPDTTEIPIEHGSIKSLIVSSCNRFWQKTWTTNGVRTQLHQIKPKIGYWSSSNRHSRLEEKTLAKLRIGHTYLTHSFIFAQQQRPVCSQCRDTLNVKHLLIDCAKYDRERLQIQGYCRLHNIQLSLAVLLGDENPELLTLLFSFLSTTGLLRRL